MNTAHGVELARWSAVAWAVACWGSPALAHADASCTPAAINWSVSSWKIQASGPVPCALSEIAADVPPEALELVDATARVWLLKANLKLVKGARLALRGFAVGGDVNELRLRSNDATGTGGIVWIRAEWGTIEMAHTRVTSWDVAVAGPDVRPGSHGRAFIHVRSFLDTDRVTPRESCMDISHSEVSYLGYNAPESHGLSWKVSDPAPVSHRLVKDGVTGVTLVADSHGVVAFQDAFSATQASYRVLVAHGRTASLAPGQYLQIKVRSGGTLELAAGTYDAREIDVDPRGQVEATGPVEIRVASRVELGAKARLGATGAAVERQGRGRGGPRRRTPGLRR